MATYMLVYNNFLEIAISLTLLEILLIKCFNIYVFLSLNKLMNQKSFFQLSLPHSFLAEKMLLSCLVNEPELIQTISSKLPVSAFYFQNHQELYKIINYLVNQNFPVDTLTLTTFLQNQGLLFQIGGTKVWLELINEVPNLHYFEDYFQIVNDKFLRRSLIRIGYEIVDSSYVANISSEEILKDIETKLLVLTNATRPTEFLDSAQVLRNVFSELKEKFLNQKTSGITSGFRNLDSLTQGFQKSDLIVVAGRPSMGKTALSLTIALNIIKATRLPILFFSLEMSKEQIMCRLLAMESNIAASKLKTGKLAQNDWAKLHPVIKILAKLPFFIDDSPTISVQEIRLKLKTILLEQKSLGLIIIDYLQLIQSSMGSSRTRTEELSETTRALKNLAREFNIPIIFLSQLSRNIENRLNQTPILSDLRESGSIEQDADLVLMLSNSEISNSLFSKTNLEKPVDLTVAKHRNGPTGTVHLKYSGKYTKFFELSCD